MKIAIRSKDGKTVSDSVTRFSGYLIYELKGGKVIGSEFRKCTSSFSEDSYFIGDCEAVISKGISPDEKESLRKKGKEVLITFKTSPEEALRSFLKQRLLTGNFVH
jgi:predicted Fe-Mo cluster-binding NifX family protein